MIKLFNVFDLWTERDKNIFNRFTKHIEEKQDEIDFAAKSSAFQTWLDMTIYLRKIKAEIEHREKVIEILKTSVRCQRTTVEKEILRRFVTTHLTCVPKSVSFSEMDQLCNELDWIPLVGRSILFLQGDFGNIYYMIAHGSVGLYLEPSKDREMTIAREFGGLRSQPFLGTDEDLNRLGNNIFNLPQGAGFGEYAILASSNKIRSCAAVATHEQSVLLIMHADTYNAVLRQHHYRQKQLSSATALLSELPLFKTYNYSKIASIAYTMRNQTYSAQSIVVNVGDVINNVILIVSGQVKVYAAPGVITTSSSKSRTSTEGGDSVARIIEKRIPRLAVAMLGRGQIIGESEMHKNIRTFQMTYETSSASTEVLEMPATVYKESVGSSEFRQSQAYRMVEEMNDFNEQRQIGRLTRAYDAMRGMMGGSTREVKSKDELLNVLPVIVDPCGGGSTCSGFGASMASGTRQRAITRNTFNNPDILRVTRKTSFGVTLAADEALSPKELAAFTHGVNVKHVTPKKTAPNPISPTAPSSSSKYPMSNVLSPRSHKLKSTLPSQRGLVQNLR